MTCAMDAMVSLECLGMSLLGMVLLGIPNALIPYHLSSLNAFGMSSYRGPPETGIRDANQS